MYHEKLCCLIVFASGISSVQQETGMGTKQWDILIDTTFTAECRIITYARGDLEPLVLGHKLYSKISSNMVNSKMSQLKTPMDLEGNDMFWIHTTILM